VWTKKLGAELGHVRADDGTFWMSFRDFVTRFSRVDVCKAHEGWFVNSLEMASSGAAFELELDPGLTETETAASWAYVMALQKSKRGRGSAGFWYDDWHVAIYVRDAARDAWAPVTAAAGARERDSQMEVMFEPGVRYLVRAYSFARERSGEKSPNHRHRDAAPATLRVYSARKLRVRPAKFAAGGSPSLAPAIHAGMFDSSRASEVSNSTNPADVVERKTVRVCGGAVVVCRTHGGVHVFAVNASSAELRVRLAVRARGGADVYQHPAPLVRRAAEPPSRRGGKYRYVPPGETAPGTVGRETVRETPRKDWRGRNTPSRPNARGFWRWRWRRALPSPGGTRSTCACQPSARRALNARLAKQKLARARPRPKTRKRSTPWPRTPWPSSGSLRLRPARRTRSSPPRSPPPSPRRPPRRSPAGSPPRATITICSSWTTMRTTRTKRKKRKKRMRSCS
jgi:hypothetical protein